MTLQALSGWAESCHQRCRAQVCAVLLCFAVPRCSLAMLRGGDRGRPGGCCAAWYAFQRSPLTELIALRPLVAGPRLLLHAVIR